MEVLGLTCNHCGAPLEVPSGTRFVTCRYCSSRLEVHRTESAAYTEVVEALSQKTAEIAEDLETIKLQNRLEQLDREWAMARESYLWRDEHGHQHLPSKTGSIVGAVIAIVGGVVWIGFTSNIGAPGFFPLFGLIVIAVGVISAVTSASKAGAYEAKLAEYEARRREILERMKQS